MTGFREEGEKSFRRALESDEIKGRKKSKKVIREQTDAIDKNTEAYSKENKALIDLARTMSNDIENRRNAD